MSAPVTVTAGDVHSMKGVDHRDAIARLFQENRGRLLALAKKIVGAEDADDVVQDAFVSALRAHEQFRGDALLSTWMYRVTYNAALMRLRARRRKAADSLDAMPIKRADAVTLAHSPRATDVFDVSARRDACGAVDDALASLRPSDRDIVKLRYVDGLSTIDVAHATGLSISAAKTRLHRARAVLKDVLERDTRIAF